MIKRLYLALIVSAALPIPALAQNLSGQYGSLLLVERDGRVSGAFAESRMGNGTEDAPQFSCIFLFEGPLTGKTAAIRTWFPGDRERITGTLRATPDGVSMQFEYDLPGCGMTSGDMAREPYPLTLVETRPAWIGVGIVTAKRTVLHPRPGGQAGRTKPYLVQYDAAAVLERKGSWTRIEYAGGEKPVSGWIRSADLVVAASAPPP